MNSNISKEDYDLFCKNFKVNEIDGVISIEQIQSLNKSLTIFSYPMYGNIFTQALLFNSYDSNCSIPDFLGEGKFFVNPFCMIAGSYYSSMLDVQITFANYSYRKIMEEFCFSLKIPDLIPIEVSGKSISENNLHQKDIDFLLKDFPIEFI